MKTIEIRIEDNAHLSRPSWRDWIPENELAEVCNALREHNCTVRVIGPVNWRRQLARMENPEL